MLQEDLTKEEIQEFEYLKDKFIPLKIIGEGTFSTVYKAQDVRDNSSQKFVALKKITKTTNPVRISEELAFLRALNGQTNIIRILHVDRKGDQIVAVFPYFEYTDFREFTETSTMEEIQYYMYNLLIALRNTHALGIIHRDLKPTNFLFNRSTNKGILIDFGLAELEKKNKQIRDCNRKKSIMFFRNAIIKNNNPPGFYVDDHRPNLRASRAGTRGFRAPEVLFKVSGQTTKIDIWCAGVIFLTLLTRRYPFFAAQEDIDALVELSCIYGSSEMKKVAKHYDRIWKSNISTIPVSQIPFETIVSKLNPDFEVSNEAFDLLYMLMDLYSEKRITAECALAHPFFRKIKYPEINEV